jgi:bile acid-coenzyme A ligase
VIAAFAGWKVGAAPIPVRWDLWAGLIGAERIVMAYGMTEAIGITALTGEEWMAHEGSVGRGVRETEVRILDAAGDDLPVGEVGEVFMRSPSYGGSDYLGDARSCARPATGSRRWATLATSTPTATCTSSTAAST